MALARTLLDLLLAALWQDACIALLAGAVLALAGRRLNAATRYTALQGMLFAMVIVPVLTVLPPVVSGSANAEIRDVVLLPGSAAAVPANAAPAAGPPRISLASSDAAVVALTAVWLTGVVFFGGRLALGAVKLSRLARRSARIGERAGVRVLASPDLTMPIAFGLFAPSVAVPSELAARGGEEFECIVLHELAHVRRCDAWANGWERLAHAVFFYNPAVLLVLRAIAFERESACDDWAVAQSHDLDAYVRSLASFALRRAGYHNLVACGVAGFGRGTVARLRRLEDAHRNGAVPIVRSALGGFTMMLVLLALGMQTLAPSIALAANDRASGPLAASDPCPRRVQGPRFPSLPPGLHAAVDATVAPQGSISGPAIVTSSGNPRFDAVTVRNARALLVAVGETVPPRCHGVAAGTYHMVLESGVPFRNHPNGLRWTVSTEQMKKPIVLLFPNPPRTTH
ncbi:MAG TPA: M56 family metallopeptidase [Candidatus Elarobacter sp.]|jgi:beta-lactamase regulating signal transducer with metallopeptidase domain|nr:M56 family metallopeptidase [Candidatus Elarobacter sp.]